MSSAGQIVGGLVGAVAGTLIPGVGTWIGAQIGMTLGGLVDPPKGPTIEGPRLSDLTVQTSTYGAFIGRIKGSVSVAGNVFWLENNAIKEVRTKKKSGGKGGAGKTTTKTYSYFATFALGLGDTSDGYPYAGVRRIWIGPDLYYDAGSSDPATVAASNAASSTFAFYNGDESQSADPRIQAALGAANSPAWRGLAYIVFYDLLLAKYNNSLAAAQVRVEVLQLGAIYDYPYTQASMPTSRGWRRSAWNGVIHVATGYISLGYYATSLDGVIWTDRYIGAAVYLMDVAWGNDKFVMVGTGSNAYTSPDGINWTARALAASGWHSAVGWSGSHFLITTDTQPFERSADGVTWTSEAAPQGNGAYYLAVWNGSLWITVSGFGTNQIWTSPTGLAGSWTSRQTLSGATWNCGASLNGLTVLAAAGNGDTYTSPDGITWTLHSTAQPYGGVNQVVAGQDEFLFLQNHRYLITRDGVNFTNVTDMPVTGVQWNCGVWNGSHFVAIAQGRTEVVLIQRTFVAASNSTLGQIVSAECLQSGILTAADLDVTALTHPVRGYRVGSLGSIRSALEPLQAAWPFDIVQAGYKIKFVPRGGAAVATIAAGDLGARADADKPEVQITMPRESDPVLPRRVTVQYLDIDREYETGEQHLERANTSAVGHRVAELPIVMTADEAAGKAETLLYQAWLDRVSVSFSLPGTYGALEPADVVNLPTPEGTIAVRIEGIEYTSDGRLQCKARPSQPAIYTPAAVGAPSLVTPPATIAAAGPCTYRLLDIPYLLPQQSGPTLLAAMCGQLAGWPGGALMQSADGGSTWAELAFFDAPGATFGLASNTIGIVDHRLVDHASVLAVTLIVGDLFNCTELAMLGGSNLFAYGAEGRWEICAARTCTLQTGKSYLLRDMLRGLYGTEWAMGTHAVGDALILLDSSDVQAIPMTTGLIGLSRDYRGITAGADISTDGSRAYAYQAINLKPLSPVNLTGHRDPSTNDWTLSAVRRTRVGGEWRDGVDAELGEATEAYDWEIYADGTFTTVKRVLTTSSPQCAYPSASQVADFGSNQATLHVKLYQLSATVGRGYPLTATITR